MKFLPGMSSDSVVLLSGLLESEALKGVVSAVVTVVSGKVVNSDS